MLEAKALGYAYGRVDALCGVDVTLHAGQCLGLLGRNGAGKTTLMEVLEGLLPCTRGEIRFHGAAVDARARERMGIMFQYTALPEQLYVRELLQMFARLYTRSASIEALVEQCELAPLLARRPSELSGGQRQRVLLALALVNDPDVVFLDEPTAGLDPRARRALWRIIQGCCEQGRAVLLSTHYMDEAEALCQRLLVLHEGRVMAQGETASVLAQHATQSVVSVQTRDLPEALQSIAHSEGDQHHIVTDDVSACVQQLLAHGVDLQALQVRRKGLEEVFLELTEALS